MFVSDLINAMIERNKEPVLARLIEGLMTKLPQEFAEAVDAKKRGRSQVLSGLPQSATSLCQTIGIGRLGEPNT